MGEMVRFAPGIVKTAEYLDMLIRYESDHVRYDEPSLHAKRRREYVLDAWRAARRVSIFIVDNP